MQDDFKILSIESKHARSQMTLLSKNSAWKFFGIHVYLMNDNRGRAHWDVINICSVFNLFYLKLDKTFHILKAELCICDAYTTAEKTEC